MSQKNDGKQEDMNISNKVTNLILKKKKINKRNTKTEHSSFPFPFEIWYRSSAMIAEK